MRVGLVTTSFPREPGDPAGSFVGAHARWLRRAGHTVDVVAAGSGDVGHEPLDARVVRVTSKLFYRGGAPEALESGGVATALAAAGFSLRQLAAVRRRLRDWDAVCAHWLAPSGLAVAALLTTSRRRVPFLAIAHSGDVHLLSRLRLIGAAARLLARSGARLAFSSGPLASSFLAKAGAQREVLTERSLVSPMGVEFSSQPRIERRAKTFRILFLGRLVAIKGVDILIDAFASMAARAESELVICGDGPVRKELEARVAELGLESSVRFVGEVRGPNRDHFLASADVLVVPSRELESGRSEGMPVVVLEAIAAKTPVIVAATGGMSELPPSVPKVAPGNVAALREALDEMRSPERRKLAIERQEPIALAQRWDRVGTVLWRHWMPDDRQWRSA